MELGQAELQQALDAQRWDAIAGILDGIELASTNPDVLVNWPHSLHLLAHAYNFDLPDARFLYKRIPAAAKQGNQELAAAFRVLQHMWQREYQRIWGALSSFPWTAQVAPLVVALHEKLRAHVLQLLSRAYTDISLPKTAASLGLAEDAALAAATAQGWTYDAAEKLLTVVRVERTEVEPVTHADLQRLTDYVIHFQT